MNTSRTSEEGRAIEMVDRFAVRIGLAGVGSWMLWLAMQIYPGVASRPALVPILFLVYVVGLASWWGAAALPARLHRWARRWILLTLILGVVIGFGIVISAYNRVYGTDALVFAHVAAEQVLQGRNPYAFHHDLRRELERFGVPVQFVTQRVDGGIINHLVSYPALHFLVFVPAVAAGLRDLRWVVLVFEIGALVMLWRWSPRTLQPLVPLLLLINPDLVIYFPAGSLTDWIWVVPLMGTALFLKRGQTLAAGAAFGAACAFKQQPWVAAPFIALWLLRTSGATSPLGKGKQLLSFFGPALAAFLIPNVPFMLWDFPAWSRGVFAPLIDTMIYDGQGLSIISRIGVLPVEKSFYTAVTLTVAGLGGLLFWRHFPSLHTTLWLLPGLVTWFSHRSFQNYLIFWLPIALLWFGLYWDTIAMAIETPVRAAVRIRPAAVVALAALVALAGTATGLAASQLATSQLGNSVDLELVSVANRAGAAAADTILVRVTNRSYKTIEPVFTVAWQGYPFVWDIERGPRELGPRRQTTYTIVAPIAEALVPTDPDGPDASRPVLAVRPFYIRLNSKGSYRYFTVAVSRQVLPRPQTANPQLRYWPMRDPATLTSAPVGWHLVEEPRVAGGEVRERSQGGRRAVELKPPHLSGAGHQRVEVGLAQYITSPLCIAVTAYLTRSYQTRNGWPVAAQGIELNRRGDVLWYVFSDTVKQSVRYRLPNGHRIVAIPATLFTWQTRLIDVTTDTADLGWPDKTVALKVFNAIFPSEVGRPLQVPPFYIGRLEGMQDECSSQSSLQEPLKTDGRPDRRRGQ